MIGWRFEGGLELARALEKLPQRTSRRFQREALVEASEPMRRRMGELAPVGASRRLQRRQVVSNARAEDAQAVAIAVGPAKSEFYGSFQEMGTAYAPAQPFARPAFDQTWLRVLQALGPILWRELAGRGIRPAMRTADAPVQDLGARSV